MAWLLLLLMSVENSTRLIPISPQRSQSAANGASASWVADPGLITMGQGPEAEAVSMENPEKAQRFASEVQYVTHFTARLAEVLGLQSLRFGLVEDKDSQTAMLSTAEGWVGRVSSTRRSITVARSSLQRGAH